MKKQQEENLVTISEAARLRGVSPQAISDLIKRKKLQVILKSGKKFLNEKEVITLEKGVSGRPHKAENYLLSEVKNIEQRIIKPEKFYLSFFGIYLRFRRFWKNNEKNWNEPKLREIIERLSNKQFRKNKRILRLKFSKYERHLEVKVFLNRETITESNYMNKKIQMAFESILYSPEISSENFNVDASIAKFASSYYSEFKEIIEPFIDKLKIHKDTNSENSTDSFSDKVNEIFSENPKSLEVIKKEFGRPKESLTKEVNRAIEIWNSGKEGSGFFDELLPASKYRNKYNDSKRRHEIVKIKNNLRYHWEKNPHLFTKPFKLSSLSRGFYKEK